MDTHTISLKEWKKALASNGSAQIIDVRTEEEYNEAHISGAQLIDVEDPPRFMDGLEKLDKNKSYYLYCRSGNRADLAFMVMEFNGFKNVYCLEGGFESWNAQHA